MREIAVSEARARLSRLLRDVERGETVAITRHGEAVAHLVPAGAGEAVQRRRAVARFRRRRSAWKPASMSIGEILEARHLGHRF